MIWEVHKGRLLACTGRSLDPDDIARSPPKSCAGAALLRRPSSALLSAINLLAGFCVLWSTDPPSLQQHGDCGSGVCTVAVLNVMQGSALVTRGPYLTLTWSPANFRNSCELCEEAASCGWTRDVLNRCPGTVVTLNVATQARLVRFRVQGLLYQTEYVYHGSCKWHPCMPGRCIVSLPAAVTQLSLWLSVSTTQHETLSPTNGATEWDRRLLCDCNIDGDPVIGMRLCIFRCTGILQNYCGAAFYASSRLRIGLLVDCGQGNARVCARTAYFSVL